MTQMRVVKEICERCTCRAVIRFTAEESSINQWFCAVRKVPDNMLWINKGCFLPKLCIMRAEMAVSQ